MAAMKARIAELEAILRSKGVQRRRSAGLQTRSAEKPLKKKKKKKNEEGRRFPFGAGIPFKA